MSNHTPGPWRIGRPGAVVADHPVPEMHGSDDVEYYGGHLICESVTTANVSLIAAAPELLEACKAALPHLADLVARTCSEVKEFGGSFADRIAHDKLEAAIAKAEGKAVRS